MADGTDDERPWLVLQPYAGHWEIVIHPKSRVLKAECGHLCWLSPQGEPYLDQGMRTICIPCCDEVDAAAGHPQRESYVVKGALDSVRELQGETGVQLGLAFMRQRGIKGEEE